MAKIILIKYMSDQLPGGRKQVSDSFVPRADQDPQTIIEYWTTLTGISNCHRVEVDERTKNKSATYENYKGVCAVYYHDSALRRYLDALATSLMRRAINDPPV